MVRSKVTLVALTGGIVPLQTFFVGASCRLRLRDMAFSQVDMERCDKRRSRPSLSHKPSTAKGSDGVVNPSQQVIVCNDVHHVRVLTLYYLKV